MSNHIRSTYHKLGIYDRAQAVIVAVREGLVASRRGTLPRQPMTARETRGTNRTPAPGIPIFGFVFSDLGWNQGFSDGLRVPAQIGAIRPYLSLALAERPGDA